MAELTFSDAMRVGSSEDLVSDGAIRIHRGIEGAAPPETETVVLKSERPRGLALKSIKVSRSWDRVWRLFNGTSEIYFLSVAFDLSGKDPIVFPPKEVKEHDLYEVKKGETISFDLGDGAPVFPPRVIESGLVTYIAVAEADKGIRHVGEVMEKVHENLDKDGSLLDAVKKFVTDPAKSVVDEVLEAASAALAPIGTILKNNGDESAGMFQGIYSATESWAGKLVDTKQGTTLTLVELG